jgi:hypothetical protein
MCRQLSRVSEGANKALQRTGHATDGLSCLNGFSRMSRPLSVFVRARGGRRQVRRLSQPLRRRPRCRSACNRLAQTRRVADRPEPEHRPLPVRRRHRQGGQIVEAGQGVQDQLAGHVPDEVSRRGATSAGHQLRRLLRGPLLGFGRRPCFPPGLLPRVPRCEIRQPPADGEQRPEQQVQRHPGRPRLDLRHPRLPRLQPDGRSLWGDELFGRAGEGLRFVPTARGGCEGFRRRMFPSPCISVSSGERFRLRGWGSTRKRTARPEPHRLRPTHFSDDWISIPT